MITKVWYCIVNEFIRNSYMSYFHLFRRVCKLKYKIIAIMFAKVHACNLVVLMFLLEQCGSV